MNGNQIIDTRFDRLPDYLIPGDVLVINTSGTLNAAIPATGENGDFLEVHLSTRLPGGIWSIEVRRPISEGGSQYFANRAGENIRLPVGGCAQLLAPHRVETDAGSSEVNTRLWLARINTPIPLQKYLEKYGFPIRYKYVREEWPVEYYQTVYATERGSAEMPSAGRAFTSELITHLVAMGISVAPLLLHTGVASLEDHEPPYEEYYRVSMETARIVSLANQERRRVIAVGTTSVRALESVTDKSGITHPGSGWTKLVITPRRGLRSVSALLTGFHEPRSSHLSMLSALAGEKHLDLTYRHALEKHYLWHEFGDLHLILP
jgi:S-adenosylmethionine:tRNA ribosyltransferase-isomerase